MPQSREVVVTGLGVVSPIGIGREAFWASLIEGRSGVRRIGLFNGTDLPFPFGGQVADFEPKRHVRARKSLKVMSRDIQLGFAAADQALVEADLDRSALDPERLGIVFGADMMLCELEELVTAYRGCMVEGKFQFRNWGERAMSEMYPLWMLKYLPNMPACHIGIAHDARGPNNSITLSEVSSLSAVAEAARVITRGQADVMVAGGSSCRIHPTIWGRSRSYEVSRRCDDPTAACRPFDADRDGMVHGEGASAFVLEARECAEARGAKIYARVLGCANAFEPWRADQPIEGRAIGLGMQRALRAAGVSAAEIGHVNAHGESTRHDDQIEARAIRAVLGDVPVTAPKSFFGSLSAGTGAVEMAASVLSFEKGCVPYTLNHAKTDPACPINVISGKPLSGTVPTALVVNHSRRGQAVAVVLAGP